MAAAGHVLAQAMMSYMIYADVSIVERHFWLHFDKVPATCTDLGFAQARTFQPGCNGIRTL